MVFGPSALRTVHIVVRVTKPERSRLGLDDLEAVQVWTEETDVDLGEHIEFVRDTMATNVDQLELPPAR